MSYKESDLNALIGSPQKSAGSGLGLIIGIVAGVLIIGAGGFFLFRGETQPN